MNFDDCLRDALLGNSSLSDKILARNSMNVLANKIAGVSNNSAAGRFGATAAANMMLGGSLGFGASALSPPQQTIGYAVTPPRVTTHTGVAINPNGMNTVVGSIQALVNAGKIPHADAASAVQLMNDYKNHVLPPGTQPALDVLYSMVMYAVNFLTINNQILTLTALQNYIKDPFKDMNARAGDQNFAYAMFCIAHAMRTGAFNDAQTARHMIAAHQA